MSHLADYVCIETGGTRFLKGSNHKTMKIFLYNSLIEYGTAHIDLMI